MPLEFAPGLVVRIVAPTVPTIRTTAPLVTSAIVLPLIGPQGPPGMPGAPGGGGYRYDQTTPAAVVTIPHNLGRYPAAVSLHSLDLSVDYTEYVVQHLDINTVRVSMDTPTACSVLLI